MFSLNKCASPGCPAFAYKDTGYCYHHNPEKEAILASLIKQLEEASTVRDVSIVNAEVIGVKAGQGGTIMASNFSFTVFEDCTFESMAIIESFFDYCIFRRCAFIGDDIRYSVFAGSTFINCRINDSTVIHNSFMGIDTYDSDFSANDFYFSNFSLAKLVDTSLEDCNLKRTNFRAALTKNVSFRYSNPEEAFFRKEEGYTI